MQYHQDGVRIDGLAAEVGRSTQQVREVLLAYHGSDHLEWATDLAWRMVSIEFVGATEDEEDPHVGGLGRDRLQLQPDNEQLRSAVARLHAGLLPGVMPSSPATWRPPHELEAARVERRRVRISYARAWHPGVIDRVVEPYRLLRTREVGSWKPGRTVGAGDRAGRARRRR